MEVGTGNVLTLEVYSENEGEYSCEATNCVTNTARKIVAIVSVVVEFDNVIIDAPRSTCSVSLGPLKFHVKTHTYLSELLVLFSAKIMAQFFEYGS